MSQCNAQSALFELGSISLVNKLILEQAFLIHFCTVLFLISQTFPHYSVTWKKYFIFSTLYTLQWKYMQLNTLRLTAKQKMYTYDSTVN